MFIYQLSHKFENHPVYIGSTTNLKIRKNNHKVRCNNQNDKLYNCKVYQYIRDNGGFDSWEFVTLDNIKCKEDLKVVERFHIEDIDLENTLNTEIPGRTQKERNKEYKQKNKEQLAEKRKEYVKKNKEKIAEQRKEYYQKNKERLSKQKKEIYQRNKK